MTAHEKREMLWKLMGTLPEKTEAVPASRTMGITSHPGFTAETLRLDLNGAEPVTATLLKPAEGSGPWPVVVYHHAHGGDYVRGRKEVLQGAPWLQEVPYGPVLAGMGYAVLALDAWCFGDRRGRTESQTFKHMLWHGGCLWGHMLYDNVRAVDYLCSRPDIDSGRIGALGASMGGTMAWWLAAMEPRIRTAVSLIGLADYETLDRVNGLDGHNLYYYVPGILRHCGTPEILELIAPRPFLAINGRHDRLTPSEGFLKTQQAMEVAWMENGNPGGGKLEILETGHYESAEMREAALCFLQRHL